MENSFKRACQTIFVVIVCFNHVDYSRQTTIKIGVLLMTSAPEPFDMKRTVPALTIAFERARSEFGIDFDVIYHNYTGFCPKQTVVGHLSELYYHDNVKAVIGPACSSTIVAAGRLAQYLELPMVTGLGDLVVRDLMDHDMYTTLSILSYNLQKLSSKYMFSYLYVIPYLYGVTTITKKSFSYSHGTNSI